MAEQTGTDKAGTGHTDRCQGVGAEGGPGTCPRDWDGVRGLGVAKAFWERSLIPRSGCCHSILFHTAASVSQSNTKSAPCSCLSSEAGARHAFRQGVSGGIRMF